MKSDLGVNLHLDLKEAASAYKLVQAEIDRLEEELRSLRNVLEEAALVSPENVIELPGFRVRVTPTEREVFSLKSAREAIGEKLLRPFIRFSRYNVLRVIDKKAG